MAALGPGVVIPIRANDSQNALDALHLATALVVRDRLKGPVSVTHDLPLGLAARTVGPDAIEVRSRGPVSPRPPA